MKYIIVCTHVYTVSHQMSFVYLLDDPLSMTLPCEYGRSVKALYEYNKRGFDSSVLIKLILFSTCLTLRLCMVFVCC